MRGRGKFAFCFVDCFDAVELTAADKRDYTLFRKKVCAAGRFSAFEASANQQAASLYTRLCRDPMVMTDNTGPYPWTRVRWAEQKVEAPSARPLVRCMGGQFCNHRPGTCTATASGTSAGTAETGTGSGRSPQARPEGDAQ